MCPLLIILIEHDFPGKDAAEITSDEAYTSSLKWILVHTNSSL